MNKSFKKMYKRLYKRAEQDLPSALFAACIHRKASTMKHKVERRTKDAKNNRWED
jgi:hypothetical protein